MLRSQIKLTSYDFSDLHTTGEFDNRPGTGRALLELYDLNFKQKSSGARPMCANAGRAPYGARPMSFYPQ